MDPIAPRIAARARLLLVEDDPQLRGMLTELFTDEDYEVDEAADGQRGLHLGLTRRYDVIVLDRGLPAIEGLDLMTRWRRHGIATPVLVLSALGNPADRVAGLDAGAEDYLAKPFDIDELLARLRALRRRHLDTARVLPIGTARLDLDTREVHPGPDHPDLPGPVRLSERECALLAALAGRPGQVFSRDDLLATVFSEAESPIVVDTYVHYLRRKLGRGVVDTVRGRGYRLGRGPRP
ncbi:response regulator transcription factor [Pseudonocardia acidicola]|uniref:response regulator transcription factor n=1 Tax=Pseudonocardia acidicola TaxID=2724939 RepID=UPI0030845588